MLQSLVIPFDAARVTQQVIENLLYLLLFEFQFLFFFFGNIFHNFLIRLQLFTHIKMHRIHFILTCTLDLVDGLHLSDDIIDVFLLVFHDACCLLRLIVLGFICFDHGLQDGILIQRLLQTLLNNSILRLKYAFSLHARLQTVMVEKMVRLDVL